MVNTQTLRADASTLVQDVVGGSWLGIVSRLRDAADEIERLRADHDAQRSLLQEWRNTPFFDARDEWERWVGDYGARVDAALAAVPAPQADDRTAEKLAFRFHELYEGLAPEFGYTTREDTRDLKLDTPNGRLMLAVCKIILREFNADQLELWAGV